MQTLIIVVLSMFGGAFLLGFGYFLWYVTVAVNRLTAVVQKVSSQFDERYIVQLNKNMHHVASLGQPIIESLQALKGVVETFNKFAFREGKSPAASTPEHEKAAPPDASGFIAYDEPAAAAKEAAEELRKRGFETDETRVAEPSPDQINMAQV